MMTVNFPSAEWLNEFHEKLNTDEKYASIASKWEGDLEFVVEADENFPSTIVLYFDLWHGKSRGVAYDAKLDRESDFPLSAPYSNWLRILEGELNPIQAMATMKLRIKGSMSYIMRNVPTVLEFTRCAQEVEYKQ
jgi:putative sterol carrier protein